MTKHLLTLLLLVCGMTGAWAQSASDVLSGEFTVSGNDDKVQFSKGNLQYVDGNWQFAEHQYEYFGWTQSANRCDMFANNSYSFPDDGLSWRILSQSEWEYLLSKRTVSNNLSDGARYSKTTIGGTYKGVIVFPDNYTHPGDADFSGNCNNAIENYTSTVSLDGWTKMEAAGCVFLPAAGYGYSYNNATKVDDACIYNSSTAANSYKRYTPGFYKNSIAIDDCSDNTTWIPVRPVQVKLKTNPQQDSEGYYLLSSVQDWKEFARLVETTPTANARMTGDIDLGDCQAMLGDSEHEDNPTYSYQGTFDGQGHTLTVHYTGTSQTAPFAMLKAATIKNIHVDGTIRNTSGSQPAVIARVISGTTTVKNVWSSVITTDTRTGWDEAAAFVGCVDGYKSGHVVMHDCLFTGTVNSSGSYNGCFVGYINSGGSANVSNCLSLGTFNYTGSSYDIARGTYSNCYVKQWPNTIPAAMQVTDEKLSDGTVATALQAGREETVWVQDPLTNQPMLALFAGKYKVPSSGLGTFSAKANFTLPDGLEAYYCKNYDSTNGSISVVGIEGTVPAETGVLLRGTGGETYTLTTSDETPATLTDNALVAVVEPTHVDQTSGGYTNFMMSGGKFVKIAASSAETKMPANRAYLQILTSALPTNARNITISWDGETTEINIIGQLDNLQFDKKSNVWYDLQGRKIVKPSNSQLPKGIYINGGRKVVIK